MHSFAQHHRTAGRVPATPAETQGWVMNLGWRYDAMLWLFNALVFRGRLREMLRQAADLAQPRRGEWVLDVGCGTGALALLAQERVGEAGHVAGIDPGPRQIARARSKAEQRDVQIDFRVGVIEQLPFPDNSFDVVLSTMMMHHLPDDLKRRGLAEIARVLKAGGRVVIVDFKRAGGSRSAPAQLGAGEIGIQDQPALLREAGFLGVEGGDIALPRFPGLHGAGFALGRNAPAPGSGARSSAAAAG